MEDQEKIKFSRAMKVLLEYLSDIGTTLLISKGALRFMLLQIGEKNHSLPPALRKTASNQIKAIEEDARREVERGFPLLQSQSVVAIWGALEACIDDFCADWLAAHPEQLETNGFKKVRIPVASLRFDDRREMMKAVIDAIARETSADLKAGVGRFQEILRKIGLEVDVPPALQKDLLELSKVRNNIVHRHGNADRKFVDECPW
jgi:hypothetical protein